MGWTAVKYILAGALLWFLAGVFPGGSQGFVARSDPAQLIVQRVDSRLDENRIRIYRPVFALDTKARPRPEYAGNTWSRTTPHQVGERVSGRYDPERGDMQSDSMIARSLWIARATKMLSILIVLQGVLMLFGVPEILMPIRVRIGGSRRRRDFGL